MGEGTTIAWCDHTFNPWWGCANVSPGCSRCYAHTWAKRTGFDLWGVKGDRRTFTEKHWREPLAWNAAAQRAGERRRVFCASMADVFEDHPTLPPERAKLWPLIKATPWLDWLLLTKRIENVSGMVPWSQWWPDNVWIGTSVENQEWADKRIPVLLELPAIIRFLSCEPLIGPVDLTKFLYNPVYGLHQEHGGSSLRSGASGGIGNRSSGASMEDGETRLGSLEPMRSDELMQEDESRTCSTEWISTGSGDVGRDQVQQLGSQARLEASVWSDPGRIGHQPQERDQERQPPGESRDNNSRSESETRGACFGGRKDSASMGRGQPCGQADDGSGNRDQETACVGGIAEDDSRRLRSEISADFKNCSWRSSRFWVICGGESGHGARRMDPEWARALLAQCRHVGVPFLFKQTGAVLAREWGLKDAKGEDMAEWPADLQIREWPDPLGAAQGTLL